MDNEEAELERALAGIANGGMSMDEEDEPMPAKEEKHEAPVAAPVKAEEHHETKIAVSAPTGDLTKVKNDVLADLRPIIGSVNLPAGEKFDLTMRVYDVTNDSGMLEVAYQATKNITDDSKKADSLLRVINEIDKKSK